jgi:sulfur-carrier protein
MAHITLIGNLRQYTGGEATMSVTARSVRHLLAELAARYPALGPHLQDGIAVAIDGQIYQDALFQEIGPEAEVQLLPQIAGG